MPQAKAKDLRGLPAEEIRKRVGELRTTISELRLKSRQGALEQPHRIQFLKRDVARLLTVLREPSQAP